MLVGGPGAIAFAMPALLWCGLVYPVFTVSVLTFAFSTGALTVMIAAYLPGAPGGYDVQAMASMRLAAFMIALAPVTLAIVVRNRDELISKLSLARQRIDVAMEAGGIVATWDLNLARDDLATEAMLFERLEIIDMSGCGLLGGKLIDLIHPEDRARVLGMLGAALASGTDYHCRCRILTPQGETRWLVVLGKQVRDSRGAASHLIGILIDVTVQTETAEALEQSNKRFNIVSESIPQIVWSADAHGRHDYFNRRWSVFTGIAPDDIRPETWEELVHPDDKPRVDATWHACLATGETYSIDYRFRRHDGIYRWVKVLALPLRNADGAITRWYGTSTDIDDAKQLEAEREIVARELDHRIGNLFALVNGLVSIAERDGTDVKTVTEALRGRLGALHNAHGLIRRSPDGAEATVNELLWRLLLPYVSGAGRIVIVGDDLPLAPSAMTSIALIFHELATNAVKYGALKDGDGRLRIELSRSDERFHIRWLELSVAPGAAGQGTGFGSRLFDTIVAGQLRGTVQRQLSSDGLIVDIELPVTSLTGAARRR
jgi:PAS domain S-box-containing protein